MINKLGWGGFLILTFIITLPISWWLLAKADFGYPVLYEVIEVPAHIDQYAPRNYKGKQHFELTSKSERLSLFHKIVAEIQTDGSGLSELSYLDRTNKKTVPLFTSAEIIHLQDVANLLTKLKIVSLALVFFWLVILFIFWQRKDSLPSGKQLLISSAFILIILALVLFLGPEAIFNQLHIWIFPNDHQWYFYYEESLMSTMMKAPDLFAYIAGIWMVVSIVLSALLLTVIRKLLN